MATAKKDGHIIGKIIRKEDEFVDGKFTIRDIKISDGKSIEIIYGTLKNMNQPAIQSFLFDKEKWDEDDIEKWVKDNGYRSDWLVGGGNEIINTKTDKRHQSH